jgi:sigma-E factor negative regulatory protein RseC
MIEEEAIIIKTQGNYAWAETQRSTVCGQCSVAKGCGTAVVAKWYDAKRISVRVLNLIDAKVGDSVVLGLDDNALLRGSMAVYLMPLFFLFGALGLAASIFSLLQIDYNDGAQAVSALLGLAAGIVWLKFYSFRIADDQRYQAVVLRKIDFPVTFSNRVEPVQR